MYRFSLLSGLLAAPLLGCGGEAPSSCATMCSAGAAQWEACDLPDPEDWRTSCDTWAWEQQRLEQDAGRDGALDGTCAARAEVFTSGTCDDLTAVDWNAPPEGES